MIFHPKIKLTVKRLFCLLALLILALGFLQLLQFSFENESGLLLVFICIIATWFGYLYAKEKAKAKEKN